MNFLKGVFSDTDGRGSFSRVASVALVLSACAALLVYVCKTLRLPTIWEALALTAFAGALYDPNQIKTLIAAVKGNFSAAPETDDDRHEHHQPNQ